MCLIDIRLWDWISVVTVRPAAGRATLRLSFVCQILLPRNLVPFHLVCALCHGDMGMAEPSFTRMTMGRCRTRYGSIPEHTPFRSGSLSISAVRGGRHPVRCPLRAWGHREVGTEHVLVPLPAMHPVVGILQQQGAEHRPAVLRCTLWIVRIHRASVCTSARRNGGNSL